MPRNWHLAWTRVLPAALLLTAGCGRFEAGIHAAEERALRRQIDRLQDVAAAVARGELDRPNQIQIGLDAQLLQQLVRLVLPVETDVGDRLRIRLETAAVRLAADGSILRLDGRVWVRQAPSLWADLELHGGFADATIDPASETLRTLVEIDELELRRSDGGFARTLSLRVLTAALSRTGFDALSDAVPQVAIPVGFDRSIAIDGTRGGIFTIRPAEVPLHVSVAGVFPSEGLLWVVLEAGAGPWRRRGTDAPREEGPG